MGENKVYLGDDEIIRCEIIGEQDKEDQIKMREDVLKLGEKVTGKLKILTDLTKMGKSLPESRKETVKSITLEEVGKTALFGASTVNRVIASFIVKATGMGHKVKYFKTEEEALKWLKE